MNARVEAAWLERRHGPRPAIQGASPKLAAAVAALAAPRLDPDSTLLEARRALEGTAFMWSAEGNLACSPERTALVEELGELIDAFGGRTPAARLFPGLERRRAASDELDTLQG